MVQNEEAAPVPVEQVLGGHTMVPLPAGTTASVVLMLVKLDNGDWCARSFGDGYSRLEFLGQLVAYTHALTVDEAGTWVPPEDEDEDVPPPANRSTSDTP